MLSPELVSYFSSPAGRELLSLASKLPEDVLSRLSHLRKLVDPQVAAAAVELLELRNRARAKFGRADDMFFTRQGLEQSTSEAVARWRAGRFPKGAAILDLCCGIGGDAIALAERGHVVCVDASPVHAACAAANLEEYSSHDAVCCADVTRLKLKGDAVFFDPSRRRGGRRTRIGAEYEPPLDFAHEVRRSVPNVAVKVSPALDDDQLEALGGKVEFVSHRGECKEAVVWFGDIGPSDFSSASIVDTAHTLASRSRTPPPRESVPLEWVFEPDPAVIRAHLIPEVAEELRACCMDPHIAYLTADAPVESAWGVSYSVVEWMPFSVKRIQERVRRLQARISAVKKRGVPFEPEELMRKVRPCGERPIVLILTRVAGKAVAIFCDPPTAKESAASGAARTDIG